MSKSSVGGATIGPSALVLAILYELEAKLRALAMSDRTGNIDLRRVPLTAADHEQLRSLLGQGEVVAEITALGPSKITETRFAGAWWIEHKNAAGDSVGETIEIARVPEIMAADPPDVQAAANMLAMLLVKLKGPSP